MVRSTGKWLRRGAALAALGLSLAASAGAGRALAGPAEPAPAPEPVLNPTGRALEMTVPLNYRSFYLGDLLIRIRPDQQVETPCEALLTAVKPLMRPEAFEKLGALAGPDKGAPCGLARLREGGFDFRFDPGAVNIVFAPTLDQKAEGNISVQARQQRAGSPNAAREATVAAYLNLRAAADYIGRSPSSNEGLKAPRLDMEGAARWQDVVIEAEATFEPDEVSLFGESGEGFKRRGARIVRDFEEEAVRLKIGDVDPGGTGFQFRPELLGVSVERSYGKLQPSRNIRATSRRSFRLERPSNVDVQVNGVTLRRLRLDPGDYNLKDLPISTGLNDVALLIEDDTGNRQQLEFSLFLDNDLIAPGLSEWGFAAGAPSRFEDGEPDYDTDDLYATGYYRRGLTEAVTSEAHLQGNSQAVMGGLGFLIGTRMGLFSLEGAASLQADGLWGAAFSGDYSLANIEDGAGRRHSIRLSVDAQTASFAAPAPEYTGSKDTGGFTLPASASVTAGYGTDLPYNIAAFLSGGYGLGLGEEGDSYHADLTLTRPFGESLSLGMSAGYYASESKDDDLSILFRMQYRPDRNSTAAAAYDAGDRRARASYSRRSGQGVGSWQASLDAAHEPAGGNGGDGGGRDDVSVNGSIQYTGNRANIVLLQDTRLAGIEAEDLDQRTSLRVETAIAYADGHAAIGRPVTNGFAIVVPHAGLAGNKVSIGKEARGYTAHSDILGPALIPGIAPYAPGSIEFQVDDLPPGYDLGDGLFDLTPKYKSGYALKVGSDYTVTVIGTLHDAGGKPLPLLTGAAAEEANPEKKVELFTNRSGLFTAQGLSPGRWTIEMASEPRTRFTLDIPAETVGLYRAGTLRPM